MNHSKSVISLSISWVWAVVWMWPYAVSAGTLTGDLRAYDYTSLGWGAALGLLGGLLALIVALATDRRVVSQVLTESLRNALVSPIAGAAAFLALEGMVGMGWFFPPPVGRFLILIASGWAGTAFFVAIQGFVAVNFKAFLDILSAKVKP
jgi:hypothetical protein